MNDVKALCLLGDALDEPLLILIQTYSKCFPIVGVLHLHLVNQHL